MNQQFTENNGSVIHSGTADATEHFYTAKERDAESGNDYFVGVNNSCHTQ